MKDGTRAKSAFFRRCYNSHTPLMWTTRDQQQRAAVFHSVGKTVALPLNRLAKPRTWETSLINTLCVLFVRCTSGYSHCHRRLVINFCLLASSTSKRTQKADLHPWCCRRMRRRRLTRLTLTKLITSQIGAAKFSVEVQTKMNELAGDPLQKQLPVCWVSAAKPVVLFCFLSFLSFLCCHLTFCATWVTQWEVQLLRSGPLEHQVPATVQRKEATPAATKNNKPSGRRERGRRLHKYSFSCWSFIRTSFSRERNIRVQRHTAKNCLRNLDFSMKKTLCRGKIKHLPDQPRKIPEQ